MLRRWMSGGVRLTMRVALCAAVRVAMRIRRLRTPLAIYPARVAIDVVFLFPDRHAMFHFIDDVAAGFESFIAMRGTHSDPYCDIADGQRTDAMDADRLLNAVRPCRFRYDARALLDGEIDERFVFEACYVMAFVVVSYPAFERTIAATLRIRQLVAQCSGVDCAFGKRKCAHPPATGGMKTTLSPSCNGVCHSRNSVLMATLSCCGSSVKG